jgi:ribosomal protein S18 acetylase RimI-like enzyme
VTVEIREANQREYERLGEICEVAFRVVQAGALSDEYAAMLRDVDDRAVDAAILGAYDDGTPVGCVTYVGSSKSRSAEVMLDDEAGMRMLAVDPDAWGRGIGTALTRACIDLARADGKRRMVLSSTRQMTTAHAMYTKLGFYRVPELDWEPVPDVYLMIFALDL